jgi:uncharacterized protein with GYD domain
MIVASPFLTGGHTMARYISLLNWTDQGVRNAKETVKRAQAARKAAESAGAKLVDTYWTVGQYDLILVLEAPDDETVTRVFLGLGIAGNVRTNTMRAFSEQEMTGILQKL